METRDSCTQLNLTDTRPVIAYCDCCGGEVRSGDGYLIGDPYYYLEDGTTLCSDACLAKHFRKYLME